MKKFSYYTIQQLILPSLTRTACLSFDVAVALVSFSHFFDGHAINRSSAMWAKQTSEIVMFIHKYDGVKYQNASIDW